MPTSRKPPPAATGNDLLATLPGHLIRRAHQHAVAAFAGSVDGMDLTPVQFAILQALDIEGDMTLMRLVDAIALDAATCGSTLDRLEAKGWVVRVPAADDRRRKRLHLTGLGQTQLQAARPRVLRAQRRILSRLEPAERTQFVALLRRLIGVDAAA